MLKAMRAVVQAELTRVSVRRKPALRRSDDPHALLATDLPFAADEEAVALFIQGMTEAGWRVRLEKGWLLLDADVPVPQFSLPAKLTGELGCCISLLMRHTEDAAPGMAIRAILKAEEAGTLERLCAQLHREWAAALRRHQPLPGGLLPYLCRANEQRTKEADT